jgi:rhamnulokinase
MPGSDLPNVVAIDLGAQSCRVSLLRWVDGLAYIELMHRFANAPVSHGGSLYWNLDRILSELENGLALCAEKCAEPIVAIGVDGWAVDYVRLDDRGMPLDQPHCYRDTRTDATFLDLHSRCSESHLFAMGGTHPMRLNTIYQLMADEKAGVPHDAPWINLPEYVLGRLGGRFVAEYTNATHTGLVDPNTRAWNPEIFALAGLDVGVAPELVPTGTQVGMMNGSLSITPAFAHTRLIAAACHDTAAAVAAIPLEGDDWAYLSSGTWSLLGILLEAPVTATAACDAGFTNLGAPGDRICFHKHVNGMWLLQQTMSQLCEEENAWPMEKLVAAAAGLPSPDGLIDVDHPELLLPGPAASRINSQLVAAGLLPIEEHASSMPQFANLIFHSLASRYAESLREAERLTGRKLKRLAVVGGGSLNQYLNGLTAAASGLEIFCGVVESSTIGNLAVQLATLEGKPNALARITYWARRLTALHNC